MKISEAFKNKKPILSFEIFPPKKEAALQSIDEVLAELCQLKPDFISVTFGAGGSAVDNKTLELGRKIKAGYGIEPLIHLTCLSYDKADIMAILAALGAEGLYNILALRGDKNPDITPKDDFRYASDLVAFIRAQGGFSLSGACYPEKHLEAVDAESDIAHLKIKVEAGVTHLVSQLFFDNEAFFAFVEKVRQAGIGVPIEAGIMPVTNKKQIERMVSLCGASLPPKFRRVLDRYEDKPEALFDAGMAYAINQIVDLIASGADGIHIYTMNKPEVARRICEGIKNLI
ncbi:MAG: methylenetetrahydrofolate reductase [NAD(P)H] [Lachnospiraceae bacterium]|jgi:methylenetetrahydrofolate reductase (NADPH)|nr:methylenetetrahydrofolate reductase [NAD(P)H] [Lachnospiraceae bacterium]